MLCLGLGQLKTINMVPHTLIILGYVNHEMWFGGRILSVVVILEILKSKLHNIILVVIRAHKHVVIHVGAGVHM